ncbi:hypothetical protein A6E15_18180 [Natrinema saccharevitans]|uniref:Uncharacterized protein n=1 Tax=Natrinema saccharevitans TaxID=301967 RepID=A0A1S8ARM5_9EURY|nr:hypothetical protein [Natrinema saccharevitans]OLZ39322.1 hypothetical protein A6E15_18180 [Natrinema saccharevitans]
MRRRQFLASGTALLSVAVAGCAHPPVVLDLDEATAEDIAAEVSVTVEPGSEEYSLVASVLENGSTGRSERYELFDRADTIRFGDSFYDVSETRLKSGERTVYEVFIDVDPANSTPEVGEIEYGDLPETDRQHLDQIVSKDSTRGEDGSDIGVEYGTGENVGNGSVFVPEQQYDILVHNENRYRITIDSRTTSETAYRYEVSEVASGVEPFADQVRDRYLFTLTGLSDAERDVVEEAIDGGYFQDDDAFRSVVDRIRDHKGINVADFYGTWLFEYEGAEYLTYAEW